METINISYFFKYLLLKEFKYSNPIIVVYQKNNFL